VTDDKWGTTKIQYVTWDGSQWAAQIQLLTMSLGNLGVIDPDFAHVENGNQDTDPVRRSSNLDYIADNGTYWSCWIHTHDEGWAEFEHCPKGCSQGDDDCCHRARIIRFRTWDGTCLQGTLQNFQPPNSIDGVPLGIVFEEIPCS
jgi:hypothetical protein